MGEPRRIDRWAKLSLLLALGFAGLGLYLRQSGGALFWGGLLLAFGEAALEVIGQWRFLPQVADGRAVESKIKLPLAFDPPDDAPKR